MLRVIQEFKPTWVIAENVRGLLTLQQGVVFEQVCLDLEASGYEVQPLIIPAVAVNAPHRRDRVWFIAYRKNERSGGRASEECVIQKRIVVESESKGGAVRSESQGRASEQDVADSEVKGGQCRESAQLQEKLSGRNDSGGWDRSWIEVAGYFLRVDDGISSWVDRFINEIITKENYAIIKNRAKDLQILWKAIQEKQIQERVGGILKISEKGLLLSFLCCLQKKSIKKSFEMESEKINSINELRNLWNNAGFRRSSQGRKLYEQQARELIGIMPKLPYDLAQSISQTWYFLIGSYNATYAQPVELGEIKLTAPGHRNAQLKAYGNAIVPQVAIEILKAIKESICI
jgi:site-specific DNA-cytosine methylase